MNYNDIRSLAIDLPEDIKKAKWCGDFPRALRIIEQTVKNPKTPECLKPRLELEREILRLLPLEYTFTEEEGFSLMRRDIPDFTWEEFSALEDSSAIDWIYINGKPMLSRRFYETLTKVYPEIARRAGISDEEEAAGKQLLVDNIHQMHKNGFAGRHIHLRASLKLSDDAFRPGETLRVHLPVPTEAMNMRNIHILSTSPEVVSHIAPLNAPQRTVCFICAPKENIPFTVEYEYDSIVQFHALDPDKVSSHQPSFDTEELYPHIRFTPFIRALCAELKGTETNPLIIARKFYDYCTTVVTYSFMREYFAITQIPDYAGLGQKGDCGVQALLFITLCRCAGIPAKWQSGLYVSPLEQGCHDWAQFYIAPYGWLFADPSFGGSAHRAGNHLGHEHYFGNLDPFRMAANSQFQADFDPPKSQLRHDPYDNQRGEAEYADMGFSRDELEGTWELLDMKELDEC